MCANGSVMIKLMLSNELHGKTKCGKWGIPLRGKSRILYAETDISYYLRQWNASSKSYVFVTDLSVRMVLRAEQG